MDLTFVLTTAPEAALGAPIGYAGTMTNTGSTNQSVATFIDLIGPDPATTVYNVFSTPGTQRFSPGQQRVTDSTFISTDYTAQTGTFTLRGYLQDASGAVVVERSLPVTIVPAPASGVYGSVGGVGPDSHLLGFKYEFKTVVANLTGAAMTVTKRLTLVYPDGTTEVGFGRSAGRNIDAGVNWITRDETTTTQYTQNSGTFAVRLDVLDSSNNVLATQTRTFTRDPLPADYYPPTFTDVAAAARVDAAHNVDPAGCMTIMIGEGAAVADYDGDGLRDIFATDQISAGHLWRNNGDGTFDDMAGAAGIPAIPLASGANFVDFDNDGDMDLFILVHGQNVLLKNTLMENGGPGVGAAEFQDITAGSGLTTVVDQTNVSATWGDYDGDSYPDVYVAVHQDCGAGNANDRLYHNEGGTGVFTDVSDLVGGLTESALGLVAVFVDYDQDGRPDIYVGNDVRTGNVLWHNEGPDGIGGWSNFADVSNSSGAGLRISAMGIGVGDYDRDGRFDLIVTDVADNELLHEDGDGTFSEVAGAANVERATLPLVSDVNIEVVSVTWGTTFHDFNNDGWEDIYMAAGSVGPNQRNVNTDVFLLNNRDGTFLDLSLMSNAADPGRSRSAVFADFNEDGFVDIFNAGVEEVPQLYINDARSNGNPYHYLRVKLIGTTSNRDALGARLVASVGGAQLLRQVINGGTFQGNSELTVHFGLGSATQVDTLTIYWPSGSVQTLTNLLADQTLTITEP